MEFFDQFRGLLGIALMVLLAWAISEDRSARPTWRWIAGALALQAGLALLIVRVPFVWDAVTLANEAVAAIERATLDGSSYMFGYLGGAPLPFDLAQGAEAPVIIAFQILPLVIVFSALAALLWHWGVLRWLVDGLSFLLRRTLRVSGVVGLSGGANMFLGVVESPLVVRPYLAALTPSRLFTLMSVGMAGVAGTILAAYASFIGAEAVPFLLAAAFMSAPGGILMAKIIMPDDDSVLARDAAQMSGVDPHGEIVLPKSRISAEGPAALTEGGKAHEVEVAETFEEGHKPANVIEAAAQGTQTGVKLAVAVGAMVMVFVALVALANGILGGIGGWFGYPDVSFQQLLGLVFAPVMYLIGIPWDQAGAAGGLFGTKIVLNEFVAFIELGSMDGSVLSDRSRAIVTFALCGFANFSSIAIQMAVTGGLAPNQRPVIAKLGLRALAAGSLANLMSAALAGLFLPY